MLIVHDRRIPVKYLEKIRVKCPGMKLVPFGGIEGPRSVYGSILCHPDIYFFQIGPRAFVHSPGISGKLLEKFSERGIELIQGEKRPEGKYPLTTKYNAVRVGNKVFLNKKYADSILLSEIEKRGFLGVHVEQGYARCSVFPVDGNSIITSDKDIAEKAEIEGMEVLLISVGDIILPGEKFGFIGGAGGYSDEISIFLGDPAIHPQGMEIIAFIEEKGKGYIGAPGEELYDCGTILII